MTHGNDSGKTVDMKILVVDECSQVSEALNDLISLQAIPLEVVSCCSLAQAKQQLEESTQGLFLAVVSHTLPDAPAGEAVEWTLAQGVPTLVSGDCADGERYQSLLELGATDVIATELDGYIPTAVELVHRLYRNRFVRVLLAHSSDKERARLRGWLARYCYVVVEAADPEQALELIRTQPDIRLLIADHRVPDMDALALVQTIRGVLDKPELVIMAMVANSNESLAAQFIHSGTSDFLSSSLSYTQLQTRVIQNLNASELQRKARQAASIDPLTGACNRCVLFEKGEQLLQRAAQMEAPVTLAMVELSQFKQINACWGYEGGDAVLKAVADHLRSYLRRFLVARIGGDEFCVLLEGLDHSQAQQLLTRVCSSIPVTLGQEEVQLSLSIGLAEYQQGNLSELVAEAESELRQLKEQASEPIA